MRVAWNPGIEDYIFEVQGLNCGFTSQSPGMKYIVVGIGAPISVDDDLRANSRDEARLPAESAMADLT